VRLNDGRGYFTGNQEIGVGTNPTAVVVDDVDGDGDLDVVSSCHGNNTVSVRSNSGLGHFSGTQNVKVGVGPSTVVLGDLDSDGDLDMLAPDLSGALRVRLNLPLPGKEKGTYTKSSGAKGIPTAQKAAALPKSAKPKARPATARAAKQ
jgi:hypothetical protein